VALGPNPKSPLQLHWQHQQDHVRADVNNIKRRLLNEVERRAFALVRDAYNKDGTLLDLRAEEGTIERLTREAAAELPAGR
jgi:hypothetical protein